ncbi:wax ester/triacylglycerol synthase domain-containing protein [Marinobacter koreensis]|uniref:wax ester/triacylglycerol synthase domain-containing protein n=1 Tax=Marinobacter koreensis TaxID=335974 RepID=UPI0036209DC2
MSQEQSHLLLPADSAWLALERPDNPMTITVMLRVEGLTAPRLRAFLKDYWVAWERFLHRPVERMPGWWWERDPGFDVRHHLDVAIDRFTRDELQDWVSARLNQPLPLFRPMWKFWLAPNAEGGAAVLLRMHHCYADGLSLMSIFDRLCPPSPVSPRPSMAHQKTVTSPGGLARPNPGWSVWFRRPLTKPRRLATRIRLRRPPHLLSRPGSGWSSLRSGA